MEGSDELGDAQARLRVLVDGLWPNLEHRDVEFAIAKLAEAVIEYVALREQREAHRTRQLLSETIEGRADDEALIRTLIHAMGYYAEQHNWEHGRPIHRDAFNVHDTWPDDGETARRTLREIAWALPRGSPTRPHVLRNIAPRPPGYYAPVRWHI